MTTPEIIKAELDAAIDAVVANSAEYITGDSFKDMSRNRKLPLPVLLRTILQMQGGSLDKELRSMGITASKSAFVQHRDKISSEAFHDILRAFNTLHSDNGNYLGRKLYAIDGTSLNIPYLGKESKYYIPGANNDRGYCAMHLNCLYDVIDNTYVDMVETSDEQGALNQLLYANNLANGILLLDRGYEGYNSIAHLIEAGCYFVMRLRQKNGLRDVSRLPMEELDCDLNMVINNRQTREAKEHGHIILNTGSTKGKTLSSGTKTTRFDFFTPYSLSFRCVRIRLGTGYETIATNLPRSHFSADDLKALYHLRWGIETGYDF